MGKFKELAIDIEYKAEKPASWALILSDNERPATLWKILGETGDFLFLEHSRKSHIKVFQPVRDCWIIV